jgi:hypothetical protein
MDEATWYGQVEISKVGVLIDKPRKYPTSFAHIAEQYHFIVATDILSCVQGMAWL